MAKKAEWSFNINANVEVEQKKLNEASKILETFYDKYNDKKMKVDTSDMVKAVNQGIKAIKQLYDEGTAGDLGWLNIRPEMKKTFESIISDAEGMFSEIKVLFNDGSYTSGLTDVLKKFDAQASVVFADIGGKYDELNDKQKQLANSNRNIGYIREYYDKSDIRENIDLLQELIKVQREMEDMNPVLKPKDFEIGYNSRQLEAVKTQYQGFLTDMEEYNLRTVEQVNKRREILGEVDYQKYDWGNQFETKENQNYSESIQLLTEYIQERKILIEQLKSNEHELFSVDGIGEYLYKVNDQISEYEGYLKELKDLRGDNEKGVPIVGDFSEVVNQLKEITKIITELKTAFEPLTNAFADGGSALSKMLTASVDDLNTLESKLNEVYSMIDTISNKQFNVTNVISNGSSAQADVEQIRAFRKEAKAAFDQVQELYNESFTTVNKIKNTPGGMTEFLDFSAKMGEFDPSDLAKRIKSRSATSLGVVIDELNEWKKVLLQFNNLRNNVEAGSFNVSKYSDTSSKVKVGTKTTDKDEKVIADDTTIDNDDIANKIKKLGKEIASDLISIRTKMEETFDFGTIPFNDEAVKSRIDSIYQQFVELQSKISALDLNLSVPTIVAQVDDKDSKQTVENSADVSAGSIDAEGKAMQNVKTEATEAATAKEKFAEANKKVANSATNTSGDLQKEQQELEGTADAAEDSAKRIAMAQQATDNFNNAKQSNVGDVVKLKGLTQADFENYASEVAKSKGLTVGDISVSIGENGNMMVASVQMLNEELAQSITYTYKLMELEEGITEAYLTGYRAKGNQNKALKIAAAAQKKADAERLKADKEKAKNNEWLIKQQSKLDTQERKYKHSNKSIDGSTALMSTETSLEGIMDDADKTIDTLAKHIKDRIQNAVGGTLTDDVKEQILNDMRILQNEIAVAQSNKYSATNMKASNVETNKKAYKEYLNAFEANAKKANVFGQMEADIRSLREELDNVGDSAGLDAFIDKLKIARNKLGAEKAKYAQEAKDTSFGLDLEKQLSTLTKQQAQWEKSGQLTDELRGKIESMFNSLAEVTNSSELSNWQKQWSILKNEVAETKYQMDAAKKAQAQNNYGKTIYNRESRHHETIGANIRSVGKDNLSEDFLNKINKYEEVFQRLKSLREEIANNPIANDSALMQSSFQDATLEVEKLRKEILATFKEGQKFESLNILGQQNFDTEQLQNLKSTMIEFASEVTNGQFKFEGFNAAGTEMYGTLDKGAGSVEKVTVALREGTNTLYAYQSGTKQVSNSWQSLGKDLAKGAKQLVSMYFGFHEAIQAVRQGLTYVKEIDLALTELKKVTDETDEAYKNFLTTASEISSVIGSTVSDFTDATAAFARLNI